MNLIVNKIVKVLEKTFNVKFRSEPVSQDLSSDEIRLTFIRMVKHLEKLAANEDTVFIQTGIDISTIVDPYWDMLEELMAITYDDERSALIWWYVFSRKPTNGDIILPWEDEDGTEHIFTSAEDLYDYVSERYTF